MNSKWFAVVRMGLVAVVVLMTLEVGWLPQPVTAAEPSPLRRVHAPYFPAGVRYAETAIFWFGQVTSTENYADVRVGYSESALYVNVALTDRRLWYDNMPSPAEMAAWDSVSLYLALDGPAGAMPDAAAYRFDAQLSFWEPRTNYQASYRGDGSAWALTPLAFTATSGWRGDAPNNDTDDRGWTMTYSIPFASLGLAAPPHGATWGLAVVVHDRDDAGGTLIAAQFWPEMFTSTQPQTWGELIFGLPAPYTPPPTLSQERVVIREGLNGALVPDAPVGGHTNCGGGLDYWTQWGQKNYGSVWFFNVQNGSDISDWPCFSKYYVSFPLDPVPPNRAILGATLTLYQFGGAGAGWPPPAQRSLIQAFTVDEPWSEGSITWNNAPLAGEFVSATWVDPTDHYLGQPGVAWTWDVSAAVAAAYAAGEPVDLVLYEADAAYHSGKYFRTSEEEEWDAVGRPTLEVVWGDPYASVEKRAQPTLAAFGDVVTYTLQVRGNGAPLTLIDALPEGVSAPFGMSAGLAYTVPRRLVWNGQPALGESVTLQYAVTVTLESAGVLRNEAQVLRQLDVTTHTLIVDARALYLPLVVRGGESAPPVDAGGRVSMLATPLSPSQGSVVTYTLQVVGNGHPLAAQVTLPEGVEPLGALTSALGFVSPDQFEWQGAPAAGERLALRYTVTVTAASGMRLTSHALLAQVDDSAVATVLVNPHRLFIPLAVR